MATYILLTRISPEAVKNPQALEELGKRVADKLKEEYPEVKWLSSYSVLGPYDYVDIFEAPDNEIATKVAVIVRSFGHATTETWPATPWERFKAMVHTIARYVGKNVGSLTLIQQRTHGIRDMAGAYACGVHQFLRLPRTRHLSHR